MDLEGEWNSYQLGEETSWIIQARQSVLHLCGPLSVFGTMVGELEGVGIIELRTCEHICWSQPHLSGIVDSGIFASRMFIFQDSVDDRATGIGNTSLSSSYYGSGEADWCVVGVSRWVGWDRWLELERTGVVHDSGVDHCE